MYICWHNSVEGRKFEIVSEFSERLYLDEEEFNELVNLILLVKDIDREKITSGSLKTKAQKRE